MHHSTTQDVITGSRLLKCDHGMLCSNSILAWKFYIYMRSAQSSVSDALLEMWSALLYTCLLADGCTTIIYSVCWIASWIHARAQLYVTVQHYAVFHLQKHSFLHLTNHPNYLSPNHLWWHPSSIASSQPFLQFRKASVTQTWFHSATILYLVSVDCWSSDDSQSSEASLKQLSLNQTSSVRHLEELHGPRLCEESQLSAPKVNSSTRKLHSTTAQGQREACNAKHTQ